MKKELPQTVVCNGTNRGVSIKGIGVADKQLHVHWQQEVVAQRAPALTN